MVHEFRSPLGAIKSLVEVVLDKSLGGEVEPYLAFMQRADARIDKLTELIGDLLSLSRIDLERCQAPPGEPASVAAAIDAVLELYKTRAAARRLRLEVSVAAGLPLALIDGEALKTLLSNLVGNAIKYNRDGGLLAVRAGQAAGEIHLEVEDSGLGIQAESLPHIFDEFFRERRAETRAIEGNGLGLAIVKRLVEQAAGQIEVESELGVGTTFSVRLPAAPAAP
jgi:signal transduction histidine kinase